jgi:hypothetical protein
MPTKLSGIALACGVVLVAAAVQAEPRLLVALDYAADAALAGCPDEGSFRRMVASQVGYDPFDAASADRIFARVRTQDGSIQGVVEWRDAAGTPRGERRLESSAGDCAELVRTMSFAVAVQIQLVSREAESKADTSDRKAPRSEKNEAESAATASSRPRADQPAPRDALPGADESAAFRFALGAGPVVAFGIAPNTAIGAHAFGAFRAGGLGLELAAELSLPSTQETSEGEGFEQHVALGSLAGCAALRPFSGCIVGKAGRLTVSGFGVDEPRSASGLITLIGPRVALEQELGKHWLVTLRVELLATLAPWAVELNHRELWKSPPLAVFMGADLAGLLP